MTDDPVWTHIRREAETHSQNEPLLASFLHSVVLRHHKLEDALSFILASKLGSDTLPAVSLRDLIDEAFEQSPTIADAVRADITAVVTRDPACEGYSFPLL
jgi:serine O-acetyltransferase